MQQELQEPLVEESVVAPVAGSPVPEQQHAAPNWLRFAFAAEFLLAMQTSFAVWAQVGGQGHLDLLPWYVKLLLALALSYCVVKTTSAAMRETAAFNRRSRRWLLLLCGVAALMAGITYYYHLHESFDESDADESATTSVCNSVPGRTSIAS